MQGGSTHVHQRLLVRKEGDSATVGKDMAKLFTKLGKNTTHPKNYAFVGLVNDLDHISHLAEHVTMEDVVEGVIAALPGINASTLASKPELLAIFFGKREANMKKGAQAFLQRGDNSEGESDSSDSECSFVAAADKKESDGEESSVVLRGTAFKR